MIEHEIETVQQYRTNNKVSNQEKSNQALFLKLLIDNQEYLIKLSDIVEVKHTNLITPLSTLSAHEQKIYGTFYYRHEIIPIYRIKIKNAGHDVVANIDLSNKQDLSIEKYHYLIILEHKNYYGLMISNVSKSGIVDINFASKSERRTYQLIDIKKIIESM